MQSRSNIIAVDHARKLLLSLAFCWFLQPSLCHAGLVAVTPWAAVTEDEQFILVSIPNEDAMLGDLSGLFEDEVEQDAIEKEAASELALFKKKFSTSGLYTNAKSPKLV